MTDKQKIKGILVNFFRQGTNGDYLKSLNLAIEEIEQLALCSVEGHSEQLPCDRFKKLEFMVENGLGCKDMENDYT